MNDKEVFTHDSNEVCVAGMRKRAKGHKIRVSVGIVGCASILLAACGSSANTRTKTESAKANLGDVTT
jgi:hypothetical protein